MAGWRRRTAPSETPEKTVSPFVGRLIEIFLRLFADADLISISKFEQTRTCRMEATDNPNEKRNLLNVFLPL